MARFAGSDTTAITLRAEFYYLMKNPEILNNLMQEIREFESQGELSDLVTYAESQRMRPERWLEASKDTLKLMERNWLAVSGFCSLNLPPHADYIKVW